MHELWTIFLYGLNNRVEDQIKTNNRHINVANKFSTFPREDIHANREKKYKFVLLLLAQQFLNTLYHMLKTNIKVVLKFIRVSFSSIKKPQLLSSKLC